MDNLASSIKSALAPNVLNFLIVAVSIAIYGYLRVMNHRIRKISENIPGRKAYPLIGNLLDLWGLWGSPHELFKQIFSNDDGHDVRKFWVGPILVVTLKDPRDVELVLSSQIHLDKSQQYSTFKPWFGNGLLISTGSQWRHQRKLIAPTFHLNILKTFVDVINDNARNICGIMGALEGKSFDCHDYMSACTAETLMETVMGVTKDSGNQSGFDYAMAVMKMSEIIHRRQILPWLQIDAIFKRTNLGRMQVDLLKSIKGFTSNIVTKRKEAFAQGDRGLLAKTQFIKPEDKVKSSTSGPTKIEDYSFGQNGLKDDLDVESSIDVGEKKRLAFLDLLLDSVQTGALMSDEEVRDQVNTIMFEGHDTTAAGASFFLSLMAVHQNIQAKIHAEMDRIFGDSDRIITFQDTLEMKYLERCLLEALRVYPPVPYIGRHLKRDLKLASGDYTLPAGTTVVIATYNLHRNEKIYPNPDQYDPDNFLPERQAKRHFYSFVPFSAGPRSCVGRKYAILKLKIVLATIMRQFHVNSHLKEEDFRLQADLILKREEGFHIQLQPRKPQVKLAAAS